MEEKIVTVLNEMSEYLSITQMKKLQEEYEGVNLLLFELFLPTKKE